MGRDCAGLYWPLAIQLALEQWVGIRYQENNKMEKRQEITTKRRERSKVNLI
jgi:hypothetical protein